MCHVMCDVTARGMGPTQLLATSYCLGPLLPRRPGQASGTGVGLRLSRDGGANAGSDASVC